MSFFVYILFSRMHEKTYVGQTGDIVNRLARHNAGYVKSTKPWRPWELIYQETFPTRSEAMVREGWLKGVRGRKFIADIISRCREGGGLSDPAKQDRDLVPTRSGRTKPL